MKSFDLRSGLRRIGALARGRAGQIAYCAGIALALTAIACAAEVYRSGRGAEAPEAQPALPAVEFSTVEPVEEEPVRAPAGALLRGYSAAPVWSGALGLWESHPAADYRVDGGVESLCAGTVRSVVTGGARGGFVEVESGDMLLRYCSVAPRADLAPGDALKVGDVIGTADASMPGESALGAHLHLEVLRGGESADPASLAAGD